VAEFTGSVTTVDEGKLEKAVADNGEDLLPEKDWDRQINFPHLSDDKASVSFAVNTKLPSPGVKKLKEVSGRLTYTVAKGTKKVNIGVMELTAGAKGKEFGAVISKVNASESNAGSQEISLAIDLPHTAITGVQVLDATGKPLDAKQNGYSSFGMGGQQRTTITIAVKGTVPKNGRIVLEVYDGMQKFDAPFVLKDVTLP
jgi:hypothetical protein